MDLLRNWFRDRFSDPQVVILGMLLIVGFVIVILGGRFLAPVIASIVIAYLLESMVQRLVRLKVPRLIAVVIVLALFLSVLAIVLLVLVPLLVAQISQLGQELPAIISELRQLVLHLPTLFPELIAHEQAMELVERLRTEVLAVVQRLLTVSLALLPTLMTVAVYLILVPILVFFFLKDKDAIIGWLLSFLPENRPLANQVWVEVDHKVGGYVRGKLYEIAIVGVVSYVAYLWLGLQFAALLAAATGLSVLIPYVGALVVTFPVAIVAYLQWGASEQLLWALGTYAVLQALDANVLVPLLLSETVNLHPTAVIVAILVFGGIWGFWGIFFAVPLASLVQAVVNAWPGRRSPEVESPG